MIWKETDISTWSDFIDIIEKTKAKNLIFRGQACNKWKIKSSFSRESEMFTQSLASGKVSEKALIRLEDKMVDLFKSQLHLYIQDFNHTDKDNRLYLLSVLQHYGAPTRLLDWTYSPYIAASFSSCDNFDEDGVIYAIDFEYFKTKNLDDIRTYNSIMGKESERTKQSNIVIEFGKYYADLKERAEKRGEAVLEKNILVAYEPEKKNVRLARQQGLFLVSSKIDVTMDKVIEGYGINDGLAEGNIVANKLILKKEAKVEFLKQLQLMNVTSEILFPDMEGFCKSLKFKLLNSDNNIFI
jgi:hypothetical protein